MLQTPQLIIRRITPADIEIIVQWLGDADVMRYIIAPITDTEIARARIKTWMDYQEEWPNLGVFAVEVRASGAFAGWCVSRHRDYNPSSGEYEIGYVLGQPFWGQGYASEIALAMRDYTFATFHPDYILAFTDPENGASQRVLRKAGFVNTGAEDTIWGISNVFKCYHVTYGMATSDDVEGMLALQSQYLVSNLSPEAQRDGFVTTPFSPVQVAEAVAARGLFVAKYQGKVIGYAFAGSWQYFMQWPMFQKMADDLPTLSFHGISLTTENTFQYGPICVDKAFRGSPVFARLFETMRVEWASRYPISLTFINQVNGRSVKAHTQKLKWEIIDTFEYNQKQYITLGYDMRVTAI